MAATIEEDLKILDSKLNALKLAYEQYFLGSRPREPLMLRREVQKLVVIHTQIPITNTALRFKFQSICSRYQAFKRQWDDTLRKIEAGTYERHQFKANLRARQSADPEAPPRPSQAVPASQADVIFDSYVAARRSCGQDTSGLSPEKFEAMLARQEAGLREKFGAAEFKFRVVVEDGRTKLKASKA